MNDPIESAAREHWGHLVALLAGQFRRLDLAEECVQEAFTAAARHWPRDGVPTNPPAWLLTTARRRAIDVIRREGATARRLPDLVVDAELAKRAAADAEPSDGAAIPDERLRLMFTCCHPAMPAAGSAALVLRLVAGLTVGEIARLFLVSEPTMAARITRAKRKIAAAAGIPFAVPALDDLAARRDTVLAVIYLVFTEGYSATAGPAAIRPGLGDEAIRLARLLDQLLPRDDATVALLALMLLQHSRREARVGAAGEIVLLADQDRSRWHADEIAEGVALLDRVGRDRATVTPTARRYELQARIAAAHATAPDAATTDWTAIAGRYEELEQITASPVVRLNRAVAVAEADGPLVAFELLDGLDAVLPGRHDVHMVRAELLARLGCRDEAAGELDRAIELAANEATRHLLEARRAGL